MTITRELQKCFHANCGIKECPIRSNHGHKVSVTHRGSETFVSYTVRYLPCEGKCK